MPFSTLNWVELVETLVDLNEYRWIDNFQYPQLGRIG